MKRFTLVSLIILALLCVVVSWSSSVARAGSSVHIIRVSPPVSDDQPLPVSGIDGKDVIGFSCTAPTRNFVDNNCYILTR